MKAKLKRIIRCADDVRRFLAAPAQNRVRFTGYYPESDEYFRDYYFTPFFALAQKPALSSLAPTLEYFSVWNDARKNAEKSKARVKVFFTGECVHSDIFPEFNAFADHFLDIVDVAFGFDELDAPNYVRYPLWLLYLFRQPEFDKDKIKARLDRLNADFARKLADRAKSEGCAVIARHDKNGIRAEIWAAAEKAALEISSAGAWRHNDDSLWKDFSNDKGLYLDQFRYNICPENCDCESYVTEKLFQAFISGCVPLYWGCGGKPEPQVVNQKAVLFYDKARPEDLTERIKELQSSRAAFDEFAAQKPLNESAVDYIFSLNQKTRDLCTQIAERKGIA